MPADITTLPVDDGVGAQLDSIRAIGALLRAASQTHDNLLEQRDLQAIAWTICDEVELIEKRLTEISLSLNAQFRAFENRTGSRSRFRISRRLASLSCE